MGEQNFLNAKEAREIAENSTSMKNHLYKTIKEEAKECRTSMIWFVNDSSSVIVDKLINDLVKDGYDVRRDKDDENVLDISWANAQ